VLAERMGFRKVASGPLVRSSYHARDMAEDGRVS
jgi:lipoate synthase